MKKENSVTFELDYVVEIDGHKIDKISFDPIHINEGWDKIKSDYAYKNRSDFEPNEIAEIFETLSSKSFKMIDTIKVQIIKKSKKCMRYKFATDIHYMENDYFFHFIVDVFDNNIPPYVLVTMYEPENEEDLKW